MSEGTSIRCPNCGYPDTYQLPVEGRKCKSCKSVLIPKEYKEAESVHPVIRSKYISELSALIAQKPDVADIPMALGLFYLANKGYQFAIPQFRKAIELDPMSSDAYFYLAVSLLEGKKPFLQQTATIKDIVEQLGLAESIEPKPIYFYFHAYIAFDFYSRKFIKTSPGHIELKNQAISLGLSTADVNELFNMLKVSKPDNF